MKKMRQLVRHAQQSLVGKAKDEKGATMVEYALLVALIAAVCIVTVTAIGTHSNAKFATVSNALN